MRRKVLFLCTANSCRSQMAEGLVRHDLSDSWEAFSAGTDPGGLNPVAVKVMREIGIDISRQRSKPVEDLENLRFDLVITLCDSAREACPVYPGAGETVHVGFPDPAAARGGEEEVLGAFRGVRDGMREQLIALLAGRRQRNLTET